MKKSIKKTVRYLRRFIGKEIVRTKTTYYPGFRSIIGGLSYSNEFQILIGFTPDGRMIIRSSHGGGAHTLRIEFTDRNWIPKGRALRARHNTLNEYRGKMIKQIEPILYPGTNYMNCSFMGEPVRLISASKKHVIVWCYSTNSRLILGPEYANPGNWVVVDDWWNFIEGWILF